MDKLNQISRTNATIVIESTGTINIPVTYYSKGDGHDWKTMIINKKDNDGFITSLFCICEYGEKVGNFRCNIEEVKNIIHYEKEICFLIEFKKNNIQVYIENVSNKNCSYSKDLKGMSKMGLISKTAKVKWYGTNKKWYESKGYVYTTKYDEFEVQIEDLSNGSHSLIKVSCDECNDTTNIEWRKYLKYKHNDNKYYCRKCNEKLFGREKRKKTILNKGQSFGYWLIKNLSLKEAIEIILRWDEKLNGCDIRKISSSSHGLSKDLKGFWFKCPSGVHKSELKYIKNFISGHKGSIDCKACNSFAQWGIDNICEDFLEKYWDYDKNTELNIDPWQISYASSKKIWIKCQNKDKPYHSSYLMQCCSFSIDKQRCPYCSSKKVHKFDSLGYLYPQVLEIWSEKNKKSPFEYSVMSGQKVWWKCLNAKHDDYKKIISDSVFCGFRCSSCVREMDESFLQEKVRLYLESLGCNILHEYDCTLVPINPKTKYQLPFDNEIKLINNKKIIIETHGIQHYQTTGFHVLHAKKKKTTQQYELYRQKLYDRYKRFVAYRNGFEYLEIPYWTDDEKNTYKKLIDNKINKVLSKNKLNNIA